MLCQHPFQPGCFPVFSLVALVYAVVFGSYALTALVLFKPKMRRGVWLTGMLLGFPVAFLLALVAFWIGASFELLRFPLDQSPFFFVDWFVAGIVFLSQSLFTAAIVRLGWRPPS